MPIAYQVFQQRGFICETWTGEITISDVRGHWQTMLRDEECLRLRRTLADVREATLRFTERELQDAIRDVGFQLLAGRDWISAIVVERSPQLRMASRYQGFASIFSQDAIFSDVEEAVRWLTKQERQPSGRNAGST